MYLETLQVRNLRCLQEINVELDARLNLITGDNGAGKTSLLESIYLLSRGQSFRTTNARRLIRDEAEACVVRALHVSDQDVKTQLALQKTAEETRLRIGHGIPPRLSELARICPALVIEPGQHRLVEDGPVLRRRFLDWSVFHVEHSYHSHWTRFSRALKQRNQLLRSKQTQSLESWTHEYIDAAQKVDQQRQQVFAELIPLIDTLLKQFLDPDLDLHVSYRPGWLAQASLEEQLNKQLSQDIERGFTQSGPHRAEIRVNSKQHNAKDSLSRGQQKLLITAMLLGQAQHFHQRLDVQPILLVDDLASELGEKARDRLFDFIQDYQGQCFLTSLAPESVSVRLRDTGKMFHVEHGQVKAVL